MTTHQSTKKDLPQILFSTLFIALLLGSSLLVMAPFLMAFLWATIIVISTYGLKKKLQHRFKSETYAVLVMMILILLVLVVPLLMVAGSIAANWEVITSWVRAIPNLPNQKLPQWLVDLPVIGPQAQATWHSLTITHFAVITDQVLPYLDDAMRFLLGTLKAAGGFAIHLFMTLIIAAILYFNGEKAARGFERFLLRLMGKRGSHVLSLAGNSIRAITISVVLTAMIQSLIAGLGLLLCGVPHVGIFTALIFMLCLVQIGAIPVLVPATLWLFFGGHPLAGSVLVLFTILATTSDNVIRPMLIKQGADLPILLIFPGVIGGLIAFGVVGLFIGPVILAVTYTLIIDWIERGETPVEEKATQE